jgi:hypothetical protein
MISVSVTLNPAAASVAARLVALGRAKPGDFAEGASIAVSGVVRAHLEREASVRHATAARLNAQPTGHLQDAAASVAHGADGAGAYVSVASPGIRRAAGAYTIAPKSGKFLTIPVHRMSYGKRVGELKARGIQLFRPRKKGGGRMNVLAAVLDEGFLDILYVLRESVSIPQDRTLMPSDADLSTAATSGAQAVIQALIGGRA